MAAPHSRASFSPARLLRFTVAIGLTAWLIWRAHPGEIVRVAAGAEWRWIAAAAGLLLLDRTLMAYRWMVLLCALAPGSRPPFGAVLRIFFVSTFVGTFLPSVGGDLYRAYSLSRLRVSGAESAASVLMDRVLGVMAIALVGIAAVAAGPADARSPGILLTLALASGACLLAGVLVFSTRAAAAGQAAASWLPGVRAPRLAGALIEAVRRYARHHGELVNVLAMSAGVQVIRIVQAWCLGRALGLEAGLAMYFVFIPIVLLIMLLPVTVSGLGTGQGAFVWLFGTIGVPAAGALALSILFIALGVLGNLPGGVLYITGGREARQPA